MPETSTRARLREANAILETATQAEAQSEALVKKAEKELGTAQAAVQNSVAVKHDVIQWRLNVLKANSVEAMPADLIEARRESASAQEDLEHSQAVLAHLELEYAAAKQNLASAQKGKDDAVNALLAEGATALITELADLNARRHHLRLVLQGFTLGVGTEAGRVASNLIHTGLQDNVSDLPMDQSPVRKASSYWTSFSTALETNAAAEPGEYPTWQSLWS
jgi:hypothetical protein